MLLWEGIDIPLSCRKERRQAPGTKSLLPAGAGTHIWPPGKRFRVNMEGFGRA